MFVGRRAATSHDRHVGGRTLEGPDAVSVEPAVPTADVATASLIAAAIVRASPVEKRPAAYGALAATAPYWVSAALGARVVEPVAAPVVAPAFPAAPPLLASSIPPTATMQSCRHSK